MMLQSPSSRASRYKALPPALRSLRRPLIQVMVPTFLLGMLSNLLSLAPSLYSMEVFDHVLPVRQISPLWSLTGITCCALFIMGMLDATRGALLNQAGAWLDRRLTPLVLKWGTEGQGTGRELRDVAVLRVFLSSPAVPALLDLPWVPVFALVSGLIHPFFGWLAAFGASVLFGVARISESAARAPLSEASDLSVVSAARASAFLREAFTARALGLLPGFLRGFGQDYVASIRLQKLAADRISLFSGITKFLRSAFQALVIACGAFLVIQGQLSPGGMIAASILVSRSLSPAESVLGAWRSFVQARASLHRVYTLLRSIPDDQVPIEMDNAYQAQQVQVENASWGPEGGMMVLDGLDFCAYAGQILAVVGASGSGKTSLARLLVGLAPTTGQVRLDQVPLSRVMTGEEKRPVGYLPQGATLFEGSVAANIARMHPTALVEDIQRAMRDAGVEASIARFSKGIDTLIGEGGAPLSGGQRQMVALARAFYQNPTVLVLDEPTTGLDKASEQLVLQALDRARVAGKILIVMTHSPDVLAISDRILVLDQGHLKRIDDRDRILGGGA